MCLIFKEYRLIDTRINISAIDNIMVYLKLVLMLINKIIYLKEVL